MTYNIEDGGRDGESTERLRLIASVIAGARPDLLVLAECNHFDEDGERPLRALADELGMRGELATVDSGYHLALLLRRGGSLHDLRVLRSGFHHGALVADVTVEGLDLTVIGTHLNPFAPEARVIEARRLAALANGGRVALLGDLNSLSSRDRPRYEPSTWAPRDRARHLAPGGDERIDTDAIDVLEQAGFHDLFHRANPGTFAPTRPTERLSDRPSQRLDYILATEPLALRLRSASVVGAGDALRASDHLPVVADL
jgi:exodeoxyribonuclease-3